MALIKCPECGKNVSDAAVNCPSCGYPIQKENDTTVKIKIGMYPLGSSYGITIIDSETKKKLAYVNSGNTVTFKVDFDKTDHLGIKSQRNFLGVPIDFVGLSKTFPMYSTRVKPGKKYVAEWGAGLLSPKINSCREVDYID